MNGYRKYGIVTQWSTTQLLKTMTIETLRQMNSTRKYVELGNLDIKEHTHYTLTDKWILAKSQNTHDIIHRPYKAQANCTVICNAF